MKKIFKLIIGMTLLVMPFVMTHAAGSATKAPFKDAKFYTKAQADELHYGTNPITIDFARPYLEQRENGLNSAKGFIDSYCDRNLKETERFRVKKVVVNIPDKSSHDFMIDLLPNLEEVWFDDGSDPASILTAVISNGHYDGPFVFGSEGMTTEATAIFLPAEKFPKGLVSIQEQLRGNMFWMQGIPAHLLKFRTYLYSGNIYEAMQKGASACKRYCPGHDFSTKVVAAHTMMRHASCKHNPVFYYSCRYCGECEHNNKHTFRMNQYYKDKSDPLPHTYASYDLSKKNYCGRNEKGESVYMKTCYWCGSNGREEVLNYTHADLVHDYGPDYEGTLEQHKNIMLQAWDGPYKIQALEETSVGYETPGYFAVPEDDHGAITSAWAENETRWAMANQLIDKEVLGTDYLKSINRLQMASLVVRLAERLTEKEISPSKAGTFTDSDNLYIRKAHAAGIMPWKDAGTFTPSAVVTRQEMAITIFNTLQYIKNNSGIRYTIYTPDLEGFTDKGDISEQALEAIGFTHKLGIITGTTKTTIEPTKACSIEDAVVAVHRGFYADELGWYQCKNHGIELMQSQPVYNGAIVINSYSFGDRIWISEPPIERGFFRGGGRFLPVTDPYSGATLFVNRNHFLPIKDI